MSQADSIGTSRSASTVSRRGALALGAAASAMVLGPRAASADSIRTGGGIAGGGWVTWESGEAQVSVFGSTFNVEESDDPVVFGSLRWADAAGFTLTSEAIASYGPVEPRETTRELRGLLRNSDGETLHAFTLTMVDGGGPGEALDTVKLIVFSAIDEDAATPTGGNATVVAESTVLEIDGTLEVGDIQLLTFEFTG